MDFANQETNASQPLQNEEDTFAGHQSRSEMLNDASLDLEGALRVCPSPRVEEILALLADNRPSDVGFGLDGLFGSSTESGEYSDSGSNCVISDPALFAGDFDQAFRSVVEDTTSNGGAQGHTMSPLSMTPELRGSMLHGQAPSVLTCSQPEMRLQSTASSSIAARGCFSSSAERYQALTHIPIARSLRRNLGAVGLPPVSSSSRQDFYKVADLRAPLIQMPQVMNLSMPSWTSAHPQVSDFASGCPASLASAQPVTSPRLGRNFAFGRSQLPSWALWIEHYQDPHSISCSDHSETLTKVINPPIMSSSQSEAQVPSASDPKRIAMVRSTSELLPIRHAAQSASTEASGAIPRLVLLAPSSKRTPLGSDHLYSPGDTLLTGMKRNHDEPDDLPNTTTDSARLPMIATHRVESAVNQHSERNEAWPLHHAYIERNAPAFVCDRLGDIGLCQFIVKDGEGVFRKVCNVKIPDNADVARDHLYRHFREHNLHEVGLNTKVWCPWCKAKKTQFNGFGRHIIDVHLKINMTHCPCGGSNSRGRQNHNIRRHMECDTHLLWVEDMQRQLDEKLGVTELYVERDEDLIEHRKQWCNGHMEGSDIAASQRRRHSM